MNNQTKAPRSKSKSSLVSYGLTLILFVPFLIVGLMAIKDVITEQVKGDPIEKMILGVLFTTVGFGGLYLAYWSRNILQKGEQLKLKYPNQPWMWRDDWTKGYSAPNEQKWYFISLIFGFVWTIITSPIILNVFLKSKKITDPKMYFLFLFPTFGFLFIYHSLKSRLKMKSLGPARLIYNKHGVIGGKISAEVLIAQRIPEGTPVKILLNNKHSYSSGSGRNSSSTTKILWQKELNTHFLNNGRNGSQINFEIDIPFDTIPSFNENSSFEDVQKFNTQRMYGFRDTKYKYETYHWDIVIEFQNKNQVTKLTYDVPVLKTAESNSNQTQALEIKNIIKDAPEIELKEYKVTPINDGIEIQFSKDKIRSSSLVFSLFGFIFACAGFFIGLELFDKFFAAFILVILLPITFIGLGSFLIIMGIITAFQKVRLTITSNQLVIHKKMFFFTSQNTFDLNQIKGVTLRNGMQQGDSIWYNIALDIGKKLPYTISSYVRSKDEALWIVNKIEIHKHKLAS